MEERKWVNGSAVVEMAYLIQAFFLLFVLVIHTVFYYHDKVILSGAACETAAVTAQEARRKGDRRFDAEAFFRERIGDKLILLTVSDVSITDGESVVSVEASAYKSVMKLAIQQKAVKPKPEEVIRWTE